MSKRRAYGTAVPDTELLATALPHVAWSDAYAVDCSPDLPADPQVWRDATFRHPPLWVVPALGFRQALALACGVRRASDPPRAAGRELLVALDSGAFDCRMSLLREDDRFVVTTVGTPNDARGRTFLAIAGRVHPFVIRAMVSKVADVLGNRQPSGAVSRARACAVPSTPLLATALPRVDWSDAHAVARPPGTTGDPTAWAEAAFRSPPRWVGALLALREALVGLVGIERSGRAAFDPVARTEHEVLLGVDAGHLDFRASVLCEPARTVVTTVVRVHNLRGRIYSGLVRLVHPVIVRAMLARAARTLSHTSNAGGNGPATMAG